MNTIAELQAEQDRLKGEMRLTRKKFSESAGHTTAIGREFLLKNILLPVGAIGLGAFVARKVSNYADGHDAEMPAELQAAIAPQEHNTAWFSKFMVVALPLAQQFFLNAKTEERQARGDSGGEKAYGSGAKENGAARWLSALIPIAIPLAQQYFLCRAEHANERRIAVDLEGEGMVEGTFTKKRGASAIFESLCKLLLVVLPLVQQYFTQEKTAAEGQKSSAALSGNGRYAEVAA